MANLILITLALTAYSTLEANERRGSQEAQKNEHWVAPPEAAKRPNPFSSTMSSIERGRELYRKHCVACHGTEGRGDGPMAERLTPKPTNLVRAAGHHSDGEIAWKTETGRGPMPGWKGTISGDDIWHMINFIKSLGKK